MGVSTTAGGGTWRLRRVLMITVVLAMLSALVAVPAAPALGQADPGASVDVRGADGLPVGRGAPVQLVVRTAEGTAPDTAFRLIVRVLDRDGRAASDVGLTVDGAPAEVDGAGRLVMPGTSNPPLTVATHPALAGADGLSVPLTITLPDARSRTIEAVLARTGERAAQIDRHAGDDRIGTAAAISRATFPDGATRAYVARADDFPDALTAGPAAGLDGAPILLVGPTLPTVTQDELVRLGVQEVVVLGGEAAVAPQVVTAIADATGAMTRRLAGDDRFATAAAVALDRTTGPVDVALVATGRGFADALSGGAAAAVAGGPLLLVEPDAVPQATADALRTLAPGRIVVLGGSAAVSDGVLTTLAELTTGQVTRVSGADRYATSAEVARTFFPSASPQAAAAAAAPRTGQAADASVDTTVVIATGDAFPDALAGTVTAVVGGAPVLLTHRDSLPATIADQIRRLTPASATILGGTAAVGPTAEAGVRQLLGGELTPAEEWEELSTSGAVPLAAADTGGGGGGTAAPVVMSAPTTAAPQSSRPGDRFSVSLTSQVSGTYTVTHRPAGTTAWLPFPNGTATGPIAAGPATIALNAPLQSGTHDLQVVVTPGTRSGTRQAGTTVTMPGALVVALTFPPPLISALVEDLPGQAQLIAVRPVGGLADGTQLDIDLSSAERAGADYPLGSGVEVLGGTGTAVLEVTRDAVARVVYIAGPGDDEGAPTPLLTFRIEGIATQDVHQAHAGQFFRYDIMHGVRRVFAIGAGGSIASPTVSGVPAGSPHTFQTVSFSLRDPLPAFQRVDIDLSAAQTSGAVDYSEAFAFLQGGDGHGGHGEPPVGTVFLDAGPDRTVLTVVAGPQGIPTVQPEGPIIDVFIGGLIIGPDPQEVAVPFTRSDTGEVALTSFASSNRAIASFAVGDLTADTAGQTQDLTVVLDGAMAAGNGVEVQLPAGVDYTASTVEVVEGSGSAGTYAYTGGTFVFYDSAGDPDGGSIVLRLSDVATDAQDRTLVARAYRYDGGGDATAFFTVGAGSALAGVYLDRLQDGEDGLTQGVAYTPTTDIAPGQSVVVDLTSAEAGLVSYDTDGVGEVHVDGVEDPGTVGLAVTAGESAVLTHTAGEEGIPAGATVYLLLTGVDTDDGQEGYDVVFTAPDGGTATTTFLVGPLPGLTDSTATDLARDTVGQTQTITTTVVGDAAPYAGIEMYLSGEQGGVRYMGARATVMGDVGGTAEVYGYRGEYAYLVYEAGPEGLADGTVLTIELRGVNTEDVDETHVVQLYRYDGFGGEDRALFDVGAGSAFIGRPYLDDMLAGQTDQYQGMSVALARTLSEGDTVTFDLSAAQAAGVDYTGAFVDFATQPAELVVVGDDVRLVLTVGPDGLPAGGDVFVALGGITTPADSGVHEVTITAGGDATTATFEVFQGHGGGHGG